MVETKPERNPLKIAWNIISGIGTVLGFSSLGETWVSDIFKWEGFLKDVIDGYRAVSQALFDFLFSWVPFTFPDWVAHYYFLGLLIGISFIRGIWRVSAEDEEHPILVFATLPLVALFLAIFWPLYLVTTVVFAVGWADEQNVEAGRHALLWLGACLLSTLVLLAVNAQI